MKTNLLLAGIHEPDNCIVSDFIEWALPSNGGFFITSDGNILNKKERIFQYIEDALIQDRSHVLFSHVTEIANDFHRNGS